MGQKWTPVGAVTLVFTTGDPGLGVKLAAANLMRQADIASTYFLKSGVKEQLTGKLQKLVKLHQQGRLRNASAKKIARMAGGMDLTRHTAKSALKGILEDQFKSQAKARALAMGQELLKRANPRDKKAIAMMLAGIAREIDAGAKPLGYHQFFYNVEVRQVAKVWRKDDHNTGATHDMRHWSAQVQDGSDCISLGDLIVQNSPSRMLAVCGKTRGYVMSNRGKWWSRPVDYKPLWNDSCSGGTHDRSIWMPQCKPGYIAAGVVVNYEGSTKPLPNRIACLKMDPTILSIENGQFAGLKWETNDQNSGSKMDVTIYNRTFMGIPMSWAVTGYPGANDMRALARLDIPVSRTHPGIVARENQRTASLTAAANRPITQRQGNPTRPTAQPTAQYRVGQNVLVRRPADRRWIVSRVLAQDPRSGYLIQYQDTNQRMWVPASIMRHQPAGPGNTNANGIAGNFQIGQTVRVQRPGGHRWIVSRVLAQDPRNGILVQYQDNNQRMWVPNSIVRR